MTPSDPEARLLLQQMLDAYHELAPEGQAEILVTRLAAALYARGARCAIGVQLPLEEKTIHHSFDADQRLVWVCKLWNQVMGYRSRDAIGKHASSFCTPDTYAFAQAVLWPELLASGKVGPVLVTLLTSRGQALPAKARSEVLRDSEGLFVRTFTRLAVLLPPAAVWVVVV